MPDVYATPNSVADRWRPLTPDEQIKAQTLILDASLLVRRRFPTLEARIASGDLDEREVTAVVAGMVKRALSGLQDTVSQQSETLGSLSRSRTFANPLGNLYLTPEEIERLTDRRTRRAFSVDLSQRPM